ncbi:nodal modulator 1-like [Haliotis rufescens]|uniref:nodal modulator 1-like n=1 Tax=Haliotis rufescens TaxID=6454 RepID=UPI00201EA88C|nr:nodal modulator 1-like [Haliotis rufescens]
MAWISCARNLCLVLFCLLSENKNVFADGVLGCGGFVKSDVDINFSLVEVKLYTPHGSMKYQTDCAPNTGYYLIPLYDKGDFLLKVEPPKGWSFEPESVELQVDGATDKCSLGEDINFKFTGFSITGKVISKGETDGPSGVKVTVTPAGKDEVLQTVTTATDGSFSFSHILPGDYVVKATHPTWRLQQGETKVTVASDNANTGSSLVIAGYDVMGSVSSEGDPIRGVNFVLFSDKVKKQDVSGCESKPVKGFTSTMGTPLCHVISAANGAFSFPSLPTGKYTIVPFYKGEHITFDVVPAKLEFVVGHQSIKLEKGFQVAGFSVSGRVLDAPKGVGIGKAKVTLDGKAQTTTASDGLYHLDNMKTGTYTLNVETDHIFFDELSVKITPNTPQLPDIVASGFSMCGEVVIDRVPEGLNQVPVQRKVIYYPEGRGSDAVSITTDSAGKFCARVKPGKYVVKVHLSEQEVKAGLTLAPAERVVIIKSKPVSDVRFSQFRAKVHGAVTCMEKCGHIDMSLDSLSRADSKQVVQVQESAKGNTFSFENVLPGKYKVTMLQDSWCWKDKTLEIEVVDQDLTGVDFVQTGYILKCSISHEITLNFAHEKKSGSVGSFQLNKGTNRFCLAQPGVYRLTPDSCHKFEKDVYTYDTWNPLMVTLMAVQHLTHGSISTQDKVDDIKVVITSSVSDAPTVLGPLKPEASKDNKQPAKGPFVYKFSHWAKTGEKLMYTVKSAELLFYPPAVDTTIIGDLCPGEVAVFEGKRGVFILGQVKPALEGVKISVTAQDGSIDTIVLHTEASGKFKVGPLHSDVMYDVSAEKTGYMLTKEKGQQAVFRAFKLGEVQVTVVDEAKRALSTVLLSLSGGNQYRSNNVTGDNGTIAFTALSPGQYFLRPMMKEYKFEPSSQMIDVQEGTTRKITITGARVAYSCYGRVTSLNGEPEPGIVVEAVGQDKCSGYQEESKTEQDGTYRIRGLEPKCDYVLRLKGGEVNTHIERTAPKSRVLKVDSKDFQDVNVIAFRHLNQLDISGNIIVPQEHLASLKVLLYREDSPDSPIHTINMAVTTFFYMPSLPIDSKVYTIRVESTLHKGMYDYSLPEVLFTANTTYHHFTLVFQPKRKSLEQELSSGSFLLLPLLLGAVYLAYNYQKVLPFMSQGIDQVQSMMKPPQYDVMTATPEPMQDISAAAAARKKAKPRKT